MTHTSDNVQEWGDESHRNCYNAMINLMTKNYPDFDVFHMEGPISLFGADAYFEKFYKGKFPENVNEVILMACRHIEYRLLIKV